MEESNQQRTYCIYIHINKENKKVYVGQTGMKPEKRWKNGLGYKGCTYFYHAIKKYGWDGFYHVILYDHLTQKEANYLEAIVIKQFNSTNPSHGYNLMTGGGNSKHSEETKRKMREHHWDEKGEKGPMYGRKGILSPVYKNGKSCNKHKSNKDKNQRKHEHIPQSKCKRVKCIETNEIFESAREIEEKLGLDHSSISKCCKDSSRTCGHLHWEYAEAESKDTEASKTKEHLSQCAPRLKCRPVICIETQEIFKSAKEIEELTGISASSITKCCKEKLHTSGGCHWEYAEEYKESKEKILTISLLAQKQKQGPTNSRPVLCIETGVQYNSAREAERETGIFATSITQCCKGKQKKTKGYHWKYVENK